MSDLQGVRGTRDFYPDEYRRREWLFGHFRAAAHAFGFEEVDAPVLEHAELYTRKAGEEIIDQLYHFELHDRQLALRPEMTPQIARMVMARAGGLPLPLRWFTVTQNWRYERMTRGRTREHYQWNMDIWGEPGIGAEQGRLVGACLTDYQGDGLSMIYSFYDPDHEGRAGLGNYIILDHIRRAAERDLPYVYLGYWVEGAERMQYKVRYRPLERLTRGGWERMPEREQKRLIANATAPRGRRREEALPAKDGLAAEYRITD